MKKALVVVDHKLLSEVRDLLGTNTFHKTVERALCEVVLRRPQSVALDTLAEPDPDPDERIEHD